MAGRSPEGEKPGAFGPIDKWNRFSRKWSLRGGAGAGAVFLLGGPVAAGAISVALLANAGVDHGQLKFSEWLRQKVRPTEMKPGKEYSLKPA